MGGQHPLVQPTDVHYKSENGDAQFNWRIVFPKILMPTNKCILNFQVYDANSFSDLLIGTCDLDIKRYVEKVAADMDMLNFEGRNIPLKDPTCDDEDLAKANEGSGMAEETQKEQNVGTLQFDMQIMTDSEAKGKVVGLGRGEPNDHPQLVTPSEGGRSWDDYIANMEFGLPSFDLGLTKKVVPIIIFCVLLLVLLKWLGLL